MMHKQRRVFTSLLELEAAEYFSLDLSQINLGFPSRQLTNDGNNSARYHSNSSLESLNMAKKTATTTTMTRKSSNRRARVQNVHSNSSRGASGGGRIVSSQGRPLNRVSRAADCRRSEISNSKTTNLVPLKQTPSRQRTRHTSRGSEGGGQSNGRGNEMFHEGGCRKSPQIVAGSSSTSTNSLPSITSSPSVSPSLVCPHLSLDDLLACRQGSSGSPHTIGLCQKCRLDPPPNIQSPLSPQFRPHSTCRQLSCLSTSPKRVTRGYSDHGASYCSVKQARNQEQQQEASAAQTQSTVSRHRSDLSRSRDDSLDFCLEPAELRRMQMSPTMRNSVEFIRRNSIESGRVVRIFKNGQPFERPLRVCILRGEFSTLTHLLDHINSRLLIPSGARYLFHLDGQLVYSVHELKHNSFYVVSGTRVFDYRTSEVLKEQQRREQMNKVSTEQKQALNRLNQPVESGLRSQRRVAPNECKGASVGVKVKQESNPDVVDFKPSPASGAPSCEHRVEKKVPEGLPLARSKQAQDNRVNRPLAFKPIEPRRTKPEANKFSRYDDTTHLVSGGATASDQSMSLLDDNKKPSAKVTRAKSELSALPLKKQKKNVTFMDTGRGSSPAISDLSSNETATSNGMSRRTVSTATEPAARVEALEQSGLRRELATSEVGIQVSNSIDGFLIDLPVALPAKGDDSNLVDKPRPRLGHKPKGTSTKTETGAGQQQTARATSNKKPAQFVTITERQLSHEEMTELTDLSQGDHHEIIIKWGPTGDQHQEATLPVNSEGSPDPNEPELVPDRSNTIAIGKDPQEQQHDDGDDLAGKSLVSSGRLVTSGASEGKEHQSGVAVQGEEASLHWQYPGGDAVSATPTERPVSQSGPSESVRARVTTPTPSLSTGGDNNSLTLSYDTVSTTAAPDNLHEPAKKQRRPTSTAHKSREEVRGALCDGLDAPSRNFRLVWVNGFAINDLYPENSVDVQRLAEAAGARTGPNERTTPIGPRLSPSVHTGQSNQFPAENERHQSEFKPSERYHNWICHSRKHDELVFPAGALIVLWCRWNNEQRFYGRHTSDVTCLTLATLDLDLAASAQVGDSLDKRQSGSLVHIWRVSDLRLLQVIEDDQFKSKLIFSLRMKNTKSGGCELSIAARDEKQLFLCEFSGKLEGDGIQVPGGGSKSKFAGGTERRNSKGAIAVQQAQNGVLMRASKVLQNNQLPLFVLRVPRLVGVNQADESSGAAREQQVAEHLISFGRRHFAVWAPDVRQRKLRLMQADGRSAKLGELMAKANCLCRISPDEFLVGDSDGNMTLLVLNCGSNQTHAAASGAVKRKFPLAKSSPKSKFEATDSSYSIKSATLLGAGAPSERLADSTSGHSISCLTRISGSLFMSADSTCTIRFWKIKRASGSAGEGISCEQLQSISLPPDLGFICTLLLAQYNLRESLVEFYVVSTSNSILIGSVKLAQQKSVTKTGQGPGKGSEQVDLLSSCSLSVVYEGHETHVSGLVADSSSHRAGGKSEPCGQLYFTCSLDCRICKWDGTKLIWKSMLPSACVTLAVHLTGNVLAVGSIDGTVYILDKTSGLLISYFPLTPVRINCLAYSSDGSLLAAGCANGSIFMLPVDDQGLKYRKVSIFQSPNAVVSLQFSLDNRYMLTSVSHSAHQELILWDLPNFRYMRDDVKLAADKIHWFDSICSGSEDVRAIWENAHLAKQLDTAARNSSGTPKRSATGSMRDKQQLADQFVVNLSCHRLIRPGSESFVIASDTRGHLRLFRYPAYDIEQGFYGARVGSSPVNCCRFLESARGRSDYFVSTSLDGSVCLWTLE